VDEVAAAHVKADCIIHYGRASLTPLSHIPAYYVFPAGDLDVHQVATALLSHTFISNGAESIDAESPQRFLIFLDQIYADHAEALDHELSKNALNFEIAKLMPCCADPMGTRASTAPVLPQKKEKEKEEPEVDGAAGYTWKRRLDSKAKILWIGDLEAPSRLQLQMMYNSYDWLSYDPARGHAEEGLDMETKRTLKRRYYNIEKAKNARIVGILMGTLGAGGYKDVLRLVRQAAQLAGKKTYTLLMGKPNPAKLANFPEIDVFVLISDPQAQILNDKEYLAPIITPHEALIAFNDATWDPSSYRLDFGGLIHSEISAASKETVSYKVLVDHLKTALTVRPLGEQGCLQCKEDLEPRSAAEFFVYKRSWKGLDRSGEGDGEDALDTGGRSGEVSERYPGVTPGRQGRAAMYQSEVEQS
jgi:diphthamide biosynthesis protein 2